MVFPLAVYYFTKTFYDHPVPEIATILTILPSIYVSQAEGQITTLVGTDFAILSATMLRRYQIEAKYHYLFLAICFGILTFQAHLLSIIFLAILYASLVCIGPKRVYALFAIIGTAIIGSVSIFPTIQFILAAPHQVPIPHFSRDNLIMQFSTLVSNLNIFLLLLPWLIMHMLKKRTLFKEYIPITIAAFIFIILNFGNNTPLSFIFGSYRDWMVYDRFSMWASVMLIPPIAKLISYTKLRKMLAVIVIILAILSSYAVTKFYYVKVQPDPLPVDQVAMFLNTNEHWKWCYITLGMGNQWAMISILSPNSTSVDGIYPTGRTFPLLVHSGIETIDGAKYFENGTETLEELLSQANQIGLKFIFSADKYYDDILRRHGFVPLGEKWYIPGIEIWEKPDTPPCNIEKKSDINLINGLVPMSSLLTTLSYLLSHTLTRKRNKAFLLRLVSWMLSASSSGFSSGGFLFLSKRARFSTNNLQQ
jgi:hypothetical protein